MANEDANVLPKSYPMVGADGPLSYTKNSQIQRGVVDGANELVSEAISEKLDMKILQFGTSNDFRIADFGCSVGPNTFIAMENIIDAVEKKLNNAEHQPSAVEFQVFFNDHSNNDFNTLFRTLPPSRKYFAAGVPGSFHGRLFPKSFLHISHSSSALHWLSKVPEEIVNRKSPAWNKGNIQCTGFVKEVVEAYFGQFKIDMESFLNARAEELVPGGLLIILRSTLPNGVHFSNTFKGKLYDLLGSCLNDMAKMGLISEEKVDSFNFPIYYPSPEEFEAVIQRNGKFTIEKTSLFIIPMKDIAVSIQFGVSQVRAVYEGVIQQHFGNELADQVFNYFNTKFEENIFTILEEKCDNRVELFMVLKRKCLA
ncbi:hypothetical protein Pint_18682 [Pistacia integerrima]|uniref:Uncharacterized protein n=1 Tax=Pistacia integerrima TaxID=434235 RepID=A0ACC0YXD7_9ROSI|nr:hypothetical protein Pint_18682 [Pistacia integerrima]